MMSPLDAATVAGFHAGVALVIQVFVFWRFNLRQRPQWRVWNYLMGTLTLCAGLADYGALRGQTQDAAWMIVLILIAGALCVAGWALAWGLDVAYSRGYRRARRAAQQREASDD